MAIGKEIERRDHVTGFRTEIGSAAHQSRDAFFTWFDDATDTDAAFRKGAWDFATHVAAPLAPWLAPGRARSILEIGYGGGRLLAGAGAYFPELLGVDVHGESDRVAGELGDRGFTARLLTGDGSTIPLPDAHVDVVYSFIVLQHVERMRVLERYVAEAHRVLRPNGVGVLFVGRYQRFSRMRAARWRRWVDRALEPVLLPRGYRELPAAVNDVNLIVSRRAAVGLVRRAGFEVLRTLTSRRHDAAGRLVAGGQHGLVVRKR